jgi:hypothetical protein
MAQNNGKTQKTDRRRKNGQCEDESSRLVKHGYYRPINGNDQIGSIASHRTRQNLTRTASGQGETIAGKILERLEFIENAYASYVDSHLQRLETRLTEGKEQRQVFNQAILELKQEIYKLVSEESE